MHYEKLKAIPREYLEVNKQTNVTLLLGNVRSIRTKYDKVMSIFTDEKAYLELWTETWIKDIPEDMAIVDELKRANF